MLAFARDARSTDGLRLFVERRCCASATALALRSPRGPFAALPAPTGPANRLRRTDLQPCRWQRGRTSADARPPRVQRGRHARLPLLRLRQFRPLRSLALSPLPIAASASAASASASTAAALTAIASLPEIRERIVRMRRGRQ